MSLTGEDLSQEEESDVDSMDIETKLKFVLHYIVELQRALTELGGVISDGSERRKNLEAEIFGVKKNLEVMKSRREIDRANATITGEILKGRCRSADELYRRLYF